MGAVGNPCVLPSQRRAGCRALAVGIVSGGAVRLTGSGLGCSDWPSCTATSIVAPLQYHAWIEFGNRLVNVLITIGVVLVAIAAFRRRPRRRDLVALSGGLVAGIFAEVVLGGETVLHKLAPPFVMAHFLLAVVLLVNAVVLYQRARQPDLAPGPPQGGADLLPARRLVRPVHVVMSRCMLVLTFVVVVLGTVVTSTGPTPEPPGSSASGSRCIPWRSFTGPPWRSCSPLRSRRFGRCTARGLHRPSCGAGKCSSWCSCPRRLSVTPST